MESKTKLKGRLASRPPCQPRKSEITFLTQRVFLVFGDGPLVKSALFSSPNYGILNLKNYKFNIKKYLKYN